LFRPAAHALNVFVENGNCELALALRV